MIAHDDLPLSTTEKGGFKTFVKALQPLYNPPTEPTATKSLEAKYEELTAHYGRRIQAADHLNLTADLCTHGSTMWPYLGLTICFREGYPQLSAQSPVILNLQQKLLSEVNKRFSGIEYLRPYAAATILD
ncbi:hypothetical protein HPB49_008082 [Dermacentor silvarum]|uniref:Uncharacterized protein n=1 Tax=Dermacentor silvarum TaxID=543639 RepID=A0ACB8DNL6_DERSI|nr:hypothetical protein HPB49_008082 [Dermacentor silvarum]